MIRESLLALTLLTGANAADLISTRRALAAGGVELNASVYGPHLERGVPVKLVITAAETGIFLTLHREHKRAAWVWVGSVIAVNLYIAYRNERLADRLRATPGPAATSR